MESKHKKILLIPMIVLIIITLIAIVNVILHSTANADTNSGLCPNCKVQMEGPATPKSSSMCWSIVCQKCGYKKDRDHDYGEKYDSASSTGHRMLKTCKTCNKTITEMQGHNYKEMTCQTPAQCRECGYTAGSVAPHAYTNGKCKWCGKLQSTSSNSNDDTEENNPKKENSTVCNHVWKYTSISGQAKHKKTCTKCKISAVTESCKFTDNIISNGNSKTHTKVCDLCHGGTVEKCSPGVGSKQTKKPTCTTEGEATVICSICKGSWIEKIAKVAHTYKDGVCTKCGRSECTHKNADGTSAYKVHGYGPTAGNYQTHEVAILCTICGNSTTSGRENHTFEVDMYNGKFACSKCGIVCPHNSEAQVDVNIIKEPTCKEAGQKRQQCTICKFYQIVEIPKLSKHEYVTKRTSATCTKDGSVSVECKYCGEKDYSKSYTIDALGHDFSVRTSKYTRSAVTHSRVYKCTRCNETESRDSEDHDLISARDNKDNTHTGRSRICNYTITQPHIGGTHKNGGKCTECGAQYQNHSQETSVFKYNITSTGHTPVYKCTYTRCFETYTGRTENHKITTWKNNGNGTHSGTCTACKYTVTSSHTFVNGKCTGCGLKQSTTPEVCNHNYVMQKDATGHWKQCTKCGVEESGSRASHNVTSWNNVGNGTHSGVCTVCKYTVSANHTFINGKCKDCGLKETTTPEVCKHNYVMQNDEKSHWKKCTICQEETIRSAHNMTKWSDVGDGNHKRKCTECNYEETKAHTYSNGECTACGAKQTITPENCTHNYEIKSDETSHWEKCTICNKETAKSAHNITTWTDKKDGNHEGTCTVCKKTITEAHTNGTSGKCTKCSYDGTSNGNNNSGNNNDNNNSNNGNDNNNGNNNSGNNSNNNGNNGSNNNSGNNSNNSNNTGTNGKDNTTANGRLPQTGVNNAIIGTLITLGLGTTVFSAVKMKRI